ncbi:MAG: adenylate/guanylate cyclase domain-containing protein [Gammaproteobacteria bacterium]
MLWFQQPFDRLPIAYKLGLLMVGLVCATFLSLWIIIKSTLFSLLNEQIELFGDTMANQTALAAAEMLLAEDMLSLKVLVNQVSQVPNIVSVTISNLAGEKLAEADPRLSDSTESQTPFPSAPHISPNELAFSASILFQDVNVGEASIVIDRSSITATIDRTLRWMAVASFFLLALGFPLSFFLARYWAEPIHRLTEATRAIHAGNLETRVHNERADEFGVLLNNFNEMAASLKEREQLKDTVDRYIGSGVASQLLVTPENPVVPLQPLKATIAFFDIVSFTRLCEKLSSDRIAELLNHYYTCIQYCCAVYGGFVDKYIGDGALVVFTTSEAKQTASEESSEEESSEEKETYDHAMNALLASHLFLRVASQQIAVKGHNGARDPLAYHIGFHTGEMLAGTLGDAKRLQYTVIGDAVNVAARLCEQAPPNLPVFSAASRERMHSLPEEYVTFAERWIVRGRLKDIPVYTSARLPEALQAKLTMHCQRIIDNITPPDTTPSSTIRQKTEDVAQLP